MLVVIWVSQESLWWSERISTRINRGVERKDLSLARPARLTLSVCHAEPCKESNHFRPWIASALLAKCFRTLMTRRDRERQGSLPRSPTRTDWASFFFSCGTSTVEIKWRSQTPHLRPDLTSKSLRPSFPAEPFGSSPQVASRYIRPRVVHHPKALLRPPSPLRLPSRTVFSALPPAPLHYRLLPQSPLDTRTVNYVLFHAHINSRTLRLPLSFKSVLSRSEIRRV